jgi:hypothetical protein
MANLRNKKIAVRIVLSRRDWQFFSKIVDIGKHQMRVEDINACPRVGGEVEKQIRKHDPGLWTPGPQSVAD